MCSSSEIAQKVAFHPKIRRRCVNLEGDIFDPAGTLTGGFQNAASSVLLNHADYRKHLAEYEETKNKVRQLEEVIKNYKDELDSYNKLKNEIDIKIHKKTLIEKKLKSDPYNKTIERKESLNLQLKDLNEQMEMLHSQKMKYEKELEECKKERDEFSKNRNSQDFYLKQREKLTAEVTKVQSDLRKAKSDKSNSEVEKEQAEKELKKRREDVIVEEEAFRRLKESLDNNRRQLDGSKVGYTKADVTPFSINISIGREKRA